MKPLILVKHSSPEIIENVPAREWALSAEGRERSHRLAELLRPFQSEVMVCSHEPKARETASILAEELGLDVNAVEGLHEHDRSSSPYHSSHEFQKLMREFFEKPNDLVFGKETADQSLARFRGVVEKILKTNKDKSIIIVAHGTVISLFAAQVTGCDGYNLWRDLGLPSFVLLDLPSRALMKIENLP